VRELDSRRRHAQQLAPRECGRGEGGQLAVFEPGERRHVAQLGAIAEHGGGSREAPSLLRQAREPQRHRARHRLRADLMSAAGVPGDRLDALAMERGYERSHEERIAAGRRVACRRELRLGLAAVLLDHHRLHGLLAERGRPDHEHGRVGDQLGQEPGLDGLLGRAQAQHHQQREPFEPAAEEGQPPQARCVRPVQVVDHERRRAPCGKIGREPVEAVHDRERNVASSLACQLLVAEEPFREAGRAGQHLVALPGWQRCQQRLEELAHDAVGELLLEVGATREQHLEVVTRREAARLGDEPCLTHSGAPLDRDHAPGAGCRRVHDGLQCGHFGFALQQRPARDLDVGAASRDPRSGLLALAGRERRKLKSQPGNLELEEPFGPVEVRKHRRPEVEQGELARQVMPDEVRGRAREQHLPTVTRVADARGLVDGEPDVAVCSDAGLAGVQPHADAHLHVVRPVVLGERELPGGGGLERRAGAAEDDEERVALGVDLDPANLRERRAQEAVVRREHVAVAVAAELLEQTRRALDVREQEGHGPGRQRSGSLAYCWCAQF
jgi:hypothetical protein